MSDIVNSIKNNSFKIGETTRIIQFNFTDDDGDFYAPTPTHKYVARVGNDSGYLGDYPIKSAGHNFFVSSKDLADLPVGKYKLEVWETYEFNGQKETTIYPSPDANVPFTVKENITSKTGTKIKEIGIDSLVKKITDNIQVNVQGYSKTEMDQKLNDYAKKTDLPDTSHFITENQLPKITIDPAKRTITVDDQTLNIPDGIDLSGYAKKNEVPSVVYDATNRVLTVDGQQVDLPASVDLSQYYTKAEVDNKLAKASTGGKVDLTGYLKTADADSTYAKKADLNDYAKKSELPKEPDLTGYETKADAQNTYATKTEIPSVEGLAKVSDIPQIKLDVASRTLTLGTQSIAIPNSIDLSGFAKKSEMPQVAMDPSARTITISGQSITIPQSVDLNNYYTKGEVDAKLASAQTGGQVDLTNYLTIQDADKKYATKSEIPAAPDLSGYALKKDVPSIDGLAKESELSDYAKKTDLPKESDLTKYALKSEIPTMPDLTGYAKMTDIPSVTGLVKEAELADYAKKTDLPDLSGYAKLTDVPSVTNLVTKAELGDYAKLSDIPDLTDYAKKSDLPSLDGLVKESELTDYAKKTDIPQSPDLSGYAKKSELSDYAKKSDIPVPPDMTKYATAASVNEKINAAKPDLSGITSAVAANKNDISKMASNLNAVSATASDAKVSVDSQSAALSSVTDMAQQGSNTATAAMRKAVDALSAANSKGNAKPPWQADASSETDFNKLTAPGIYSVKTTVDFKQRIADAVNDQFNVRPRTNKMVSVASFNAKGDGVTDDTKAIQAACDAVSSAGGGLVYIPAGKYMIKASNAVTDAELTDPFFKGNGINVGSNTTLVMDKGTTLKVIPNHAFASLVLNVRNVQNVNILGGTIDGDRLEHVITAHWDRDWGAYGGEFGGGISINHSSNVNVIGTKCNHIWGDGLGIFPDSDPHPSQNVLIKSCVFDYNLRQGISIGDVIGCVVDSCLFQNTNGTAPASGMDLEPGKAGQQVNNLTITNNVFRQNENSGLMAFALKGSHIQNIHVKNNTFENNGTRVPANVELQSVDSVEIDHNHMIDPGGDRPFGIRFISCTNTDVHHNFMPNSQIIVEDGVGGGTLNTNSGKLHDNFVPEIHVSDTWSKNYTVSDNHTSTDITPADAKMVGSSIDFSGQYTYVERANNQQMSFHNFVFWGSNVSPTTTASDTLIENAAFLDWKADLSFDVKMAFFKKKTHDGWQILFEKPWFTLTRNPAKYTGLNDCDLYTKGVDLTVNGQTVGKLFADRIESNGSYTGNENVHHFEVKDVSFRDGGQGDNAYATTIETVGGNRYAYEFKAKDGSTLPANQLAPVVSPFKSTQPLTAYQQPNVLATIMAMNTAIADGLLYVTKFSEGIFQELKVNGVSTPKHRFYTNSAWSDWVDPEEELSKAYDSISSVENTAGTAAVMAQQANQLASETSLQFAQLKDFVEKSISKLQASDGNVMLLMKGTMKFYVDAEMQRMNDRDGTWLGGGWNQLPDAEFINKDKLKDLNATNDVTIEVHFFIANVAENVDQFTVTIGQHGGNQPTLTMKKNQDNVFAWNLPKGSYTGQPNYLEIDMISQPGGFIIDQQQSYVVAKKN